MKLLKQYFIILSALFNIAILPKLVLCDSPSQLELLFINNSNMYTLKYQCIPVSATFNKDRELNLRAKKYYYSFEGTEVCFFNNCTKVSQQEGFNYIWILPYVFPNENGFTCDFGDGSIGNGSFGAGIYKVRMWAFLGTEEKGYMEVVVETDETGPYDTHFKLTDKYDPVNGFTPYFEYRCWSIGIAYGPYLELSDLNHYIKEWDPYPLPLNIYGFPHNNKNFGNFKYGYGTTSGINPCPNDYTYFPQICISDCDIYYQGNHIVHNQSNTGESFTREGRIPLNTTFQKNITTRANYPQYSSANADVNLSAEPGVKLTIGNGLNYSSPTGDISFALKPYTNQFGNVLTIKNPIDPNNPLVENPTTTLALEDLENSQNYNQNAKLIVESNCKTIIENNAKLYCGKYSQIILEKSASNPSTNGGQMFLENGSIVEMKEYSQIQIKDKCLLKNINATFINNIGAKIKVESGGFFELMDNVNQSITNGGKVIIEGGGILKIGANSELVFEGTNSNFIINPNSIILLGANAKIEFKNGANLIADGSNISSLNGSTPGNGIKIEDAGVLTEISNCTFTNLINPVRISNNNSSTANIFRNVSNNVFNMNQYCHYVLETLNANNINLINNQLYMDMNNGLGLVMRYPTYLLGNRSSQPVYSINIMNNTIINGAASVVILSQTSAIVPIRFINNLNINNASLYSFIGRQLSGDIKNNHFSSNSSSCKNMELTQSVTNILSNNFSSPNINFCNYSSYPNLAPICDATSDGGWIWAGGKNTINSSSNGNIYLYGGNATLDWGENCFSKNSNSMIKYLWGAVNLPSLPNYYMRNNDFDGTNYPSSTLFGLVDYEQGISVNPYFNGSNFYCNTAISGSVWQIRDLGNGIMDTIYKTPNSTGIPQAPEEYLYSLSYQENSLGNYFEAIIYLKTLINEYPFSENVNAALFDLYKNYQMLDTSGNHETRDILYNDLKNYLDIKILTGIYKDEFNYNAYNITLMCMDNMKEYNEAMAGYEFISLYHPESYIRLMASWDYAEIEALLYSSGAISSKEERMTGKEYLREITNQVNVSINEDPVKQKVMNSFKKIKKEIEANREKDIKRKTKDDQFAKKEISRIKSEEIKSDMKTILNIRSAKTLKKEEKEKRQLEDFLYGKTETNLNNENIDNSIPKQFDLSQNFPNPFNPTTTIKYTLPKNGLVTIKIYDITGREIKTLVNEIKQTGKYSIDFNGSELASGVYFYRLQSGDFVMTKRMVLIK